MTVRSFASRRALLCVAILVATAAPAARDFVRAVDAIYPDLDRLYLDLHQNPELSWHEEKTAAKMAAQLRALGYEVTTGVGKTGVVGLLRNGKGPTVLLRTELDALPVEEKTGLPYASKACLASGPPRYSPKVPSLRTTRWHGRTSGSGLWEHALAAARTADGLPAAFATAV